MKLSLLICSIASFVGSSFSNCGAAVTTYSSSETYEVGGFAASWAANGETRRVGGAFAAGNTPTTIEIDTAASLIRSYGTVSGFTSSWSSSSTGTWQTGTLPPVFPNPPAPIFATGTFSISVTIDVAAFSFDTGFESFAWDGERYSFDGSLSSFTTADITVTHSFTTDSETVSGTIELNDVAMRVIGGQRVINVAGYPGSLSISSNMQVLPVLSSQTLAWGLSSGIFANGFQHNASFIPEPSVLGLALLGLGAFARRRR